MDKTRMELDDDFKSSSTLTTSNGKFFLTPGIKNKHKKLHPMGQGFNKDMKVYNKNDIPNW